MELDDLAILTTKIDPPMAGGIKYAAKVNILYVKDETGRRKMNTDFGETWGKTKQEAEDKMRKLVSDWIDSKNK